MNNISSIELAGVMAYAENVVRNDSSMVAERSSKEVTVLAGLAGIRAGLQYTRTLREQITSIETDVSGPRYSDENDFVIFERTHGFSKGFGRYVWSNLLRENQYKPSQLEVRFVPLISLHGERVAAYTLDVFSLENALHYIKLRSVSGIGNFSLYGLLYGQGGGPISHEFVKQLYDERQQAYNSASWPNKK